MAKFCKYCGKELEEGMTCSCVENKAPEETVSNTNVNIPSTEGKKITSNDVKSFAKGFWEFFKAFIKNPVSVGARFVNSCDFKNALGLIGLQSIIVAFLVISLVSKYNSVLKKTASLAGGAYTGAVKAQMSAAMFSIPTVFIITAIVTFAVASLIALVLMLFVKLFKGNTTYKYMLCVSAMNSFVIIPFALLGLILALIMPLSLNLDSITNASGIIAPFVLPVVVATLGTALGNYIMINIIYAGSNVNKEMLPYIMFFTGIVMSIAFIFIMKIVMPMCLPPAIGTASNALESLF